MRGVTATHTERTRQCEGSGGDGEMILLSEGYQSHQKRGARTVSAAASGGTHVLCAANKQSSVCSELTAEVLTI